MEKLRKQLFELINSADLPPEAIFYILKDVYRDIEIAYQKYLIELEKDSLISKDKKE